MASDGRSLVGLSIPQWMKTKATDSVQDHDDNFLLIHYPKLEKKPKSPSPARKTTTIEERTIGENYINHTEPCKAFLQNKFQIPPPLAKLKDTKIKSNGTDDGFKGEAAACSSSVVRVAHQMVSGKFSSSSQQQEEYATRPPGFNPSSRRGSKSLPTTPLGSPKSRRRTNKYFTGAFLENDGHTHWILQGLLGKRDLSRSIGFIAEESVKQNLQRTGSEMFNEKTDSKQDLRPKASELREMNFWSPTSM